MRRAGATSKWRASGRLVTNAGAGLTCYVSRADCAAAAAAVLTQDGHDRKEYDITGGEAVSQADVAAALGEIGGRPVEPAHVDDETWVATMVEDLTGRVPTTTREVLEAHRDERAGVAA